MVGGAYGALDEFEHILQTRDLIRPPFGARATDPDHQRWYGAALTKITVAEGALQHAADMQMEFCRGVEDGQAVHVARRPVRRDRRARGLLAGVAGDAGVDLPLLRIRAPRRRARRSSAPSATWPPAGATSTRRTPTGRSASSGAASSASRARRSSRDPPRLRARRRSAPPGAPPPRPAARRSRSPAVPPRARRRATRRPAPTHRLRRPARSGSSSASARRWANPGRSEPPPRRCSGASERPASASSASRAQRMPNATPSCTEPRSAARSVARLRPVQAPRAAGSSSGVRSPVRCGTNSGPPARRLAVLAQDAPGPLEREARVLHRGQRVPAVAGRAEPVARRCVDGGQRLVHPLRDLRARAEVQHPLARDEQRRGGIRRAVHERGAARQAERVGAQLPGDEADGCTGASSGSSSAPPVGLEVPQQRRRRVARLGRGRRPSARRSQSLGCSAQRARRSVSGSCAASHARIGPANPGAGGLPRAGHRAASATARVSGQRIAGRTGPPASSQSTTPCICPVRPIASTAGAPTCATASRAAVSHASGRGLRTAGRGVSTCTAPGPWRGPRRPRRRGAP